MGLQLLMLRRVLGLAHFLHSLQVPWGWTTSLQKQGPLGSFLSHWSVLQVSWKRCWLPPKRRRHEQTKQKTRLAHGFGPERFPTPQVGQDEGQGLRYLPLEMQLALDSCLYRCSVLPKSLAAWGRLQTSA